MQIMINTELHAHKYESWSNCFNTKINSLDTRVYVFIKKIFRKLTVSNLQKANNVHIAHIYISMVTNQTWLYPF